MAKVPVLVEIDIEFDTQTSVWHIQWHKKQVPIFSTISGYILLYAYTDTVAPPA
jgi:hypothetical protein